MQTAIAPPQAVVTNAGLNTASATVGNANGIDYVVVPQGTPVGSGTVVASVSSPFTITGLSPSTLYDLYVRKNCGSSNVSAWVGPTTFNTAYAIPFFQDFELFSGVPISQEGWTTTQGTTAPNWRPAGSTGSTGTGPVEDHTVGAGGTFVYLETSSGAGVDTLISPPVFIDTNLTTVEMQFWYHMHGAAMGTLEVYADTNGVMNLLTSYVGEQHPNQTDPWLNYSTFLNGYNGKSVTLKFVGIRGTSFTSDMAIDDVSLDPVLPLDAGVTDVISPSGSLCPGNITPVVEVRNFGSTTLDSVKVYWDVNGVLDSTTYIGTILPGATTNVTLGTLAISASQVYNVDFYTGNVNGQADQFAGNDTLTLNGLRTGLNGTVTLDPNLPASATNFIDFASLQATLNNFGVCGNAVVDVAPGIYSGAIQFDQIPGANASNSLTIDGGDSTQVILTHDGSSSPATVTLNGTDWITLTNMTIQTTSTGAGATVLLTGGNDHVSITNNVLRANASSTSSIANNITYTGSNSSTTSIPNVGSSYNLIANNLIIGGYYGVRMYGPSSVASVGNVIDNNDIDSAYYYGAWVYYQDSAEVLNNNINMLHRGNTFADGIYIYANNNGRVVANYAIAGDYGMYWSNSNTNVRRLRRSNEVINNMFISNGDYASYLYAVDSVNYWFNSLQTFGTSQPALYIATFASSYPLDDWDLRNNILSASAGPALDIGGTTDSIFNKMDNNVYYTMGTTLIDINGTTYADLPAYQTAQPILNTASLEGDPLFFSATDLHITGAFSNDSGDATVPVSVDIDGDTRPRAGAVSVDIGADEYDPPTCPPVAFINALNPGLDSITLNWDGSSLGSYQYVIVPGGSPLSSGTPVTTPLDSIRLGGLMASTRYDVYVRTICGRGDTSLWNGPISFNTANGIPYFQDFQTWASNTTGLINEEGWTTLGTPTPHWEIGATTSSSGTGPTADHTIGTGGTFVYLECSGGGLGDTDTLYSAPIQVGANQNVLEYEFWYHMHGGSMGELKAFVRANGVLTPVVTIVGQQQPNQTDPWISFDTLITGFAGQSIQLLFVGVRGNGFASDMAIDDVSLDVPPAIDAGLTRIGAPIEDSLKCYTATENVDVTLINGGLNALDFTADTTTITATISGAVTQNLTTVLNTNTLNGGLPLASGDTLVVNVGTLNMTTSGIYNFVIDVSTLGDGNSANDTLARNVNVGAVSGGTILGSDSICAGDTAFLSLSGFTGAPQWQILVSGVWTDITGATSAELKTVPTALTSYRALVCGSTPSDTIDVLPVSVAAPTAIGDTVLVPSCGDSAFVYATVSSTNPNAEFAWYTTSTGGVPLDSNSTYFVNAATDSLRWKGITGTMMNAMDTVWVEEVVQTGAGGSTLAITEVNPNTPDHLEIQNVGNSPVNVTGWTVWVSNGGLNTVNTNFQTLSGTMLPGQTMEWDDNTTSAIYWGNNLNWTTTGEGWVMILDAQNNVVDFMTWASTTTSLATFNNVINSVTFTNPIASGFWNGDGVTASGTNPMIRQGTEDNDDNTDFINAAGYLGSTNTGLSLPFPGGSCASPRVPAFVMVNCLVGIDENALVLDAFSIYPNPSNGLFTMNVSTNRSENLNLTVRDLQGKVVYEENITVNGEFRSDYDFSDFAKGIYYLQIQGEEATKVEKLVIQ